MHITISKLKPVVLLFAILAGLSLNCTKAYAGKTETLVVAGGCFWCVESDFERVNGVIKAVSGYTGGTTKNPTYKQVSRGGTGHYEAVEITYDSGKISYAALLKLFMRSIDPTDAGGQFCDRGESYRTAVFVSTKAEEAAAKAAITDAKRKLGRKIATRILPASRFYRAESRHQNYYRGNKMVLTRFGAKRQSAAYRAYRKACGRDARVRQLWGNQAVFAKH